MGGIAYIDKRKLERDRLAAWFQDNVPLYINFGRQQVAFCFNSLAMAEDFVAYLRDQEK